VFPVGVGVDVARRVVGVGVLVGVLVGVGPLRVGVGVGVLVGVGPIRVGVGVPGVPPGSLPDCKTPFR
jgi:hypothetical protein